MRSALHYVVCATVLFLLGCSSGAEPSPGPRVPATTTPPVALPSPPPAPDLSEYRLTVFEGNRFPFDGGVTSLAVGKSDELLATGWTTVTRPGRPAAYQNIAASNPDEWTFHDTVEGFGFQATGGVAIDQDGTAWVPAGHGIVRFEPALQKPRLIKLPRRVESIAMAPDGTIWMGGETVMHLVDGKLIRFEGADAPDDVSWAREVAVARDGTVWAGFPTAMGIPAEPGHLARLDGDRWTVFTEEDGVPGDGIRELVAAPDGSLWVHVERYEQRGNTSHYLPPLIGHFDGEAWTTYDRSDGIEGIKYFALTVAPDGIVWVGTDRGLAAFDGQRWRMYELGAVWAIAVAGDGTIWAGRRRQLLRFELPR